MIILKVGCLRLCWFDFQRPPVCMFSCALARHWTPNCHHCVIDKEVKTKALCECDFEWWIIPEKHRINVIYHSFVWYMGIKPKLALYTLLSAADTCLLYVRHTVWKTSRAALVCRWLRIKCLLYENTPRLSLHVAQISPGKSDFVSTRLAHVPGT